MLNQTFACINHIMGPLLVTTNDYSPVFQSKGILDFIPVLPGMRHADHRTDRSIFKSPQTFKGGKDPLLLKLQLRLVIQVKKLTTSAFSVKAAGRVDTVGGRF